MNILIISNGEVEQNLINLCLKSKYLDHIYTASKEPLDEIPNVEYANFEELVKKAKALRIDITIVTDKFLIQEGIVEFFRKNLLNIISVNKKWFNLETSRLVAKRLMNHYSINNPDVILAPLVFPIIIKTDKPQANKIAKSMQELIEIKESLAGENVFLEENLKGEIIYLLSLWDGKNLIHFNPTNINFTEVQEDRLSLYTTKLNFMLSDEQADFAGFFASKIIWAKNDWYVLDYIMHLNEKVDLNSIKSDFLYILNLALYQKLDEI